MAVWDKPSNPYDGTSGQNTIRKKDVTGRMGISHRKLNLETWEPTLEPTPLRSGNRAISPVAKVFRGPICRLAFNFPRVQGASDAQARTVHDVGVDLVATSTCPSKSCTVRMSAPPSSK